jgi:sugar phosphate isomerase/epimerase
VTKELLSQQKVSSFSTPASSIKTNHASQPLSLLERISVSQITTYHWSFKESLNGLLSAGIPAIGLWNRKILDMEPAEAAELVIDSGIKVSSISLAGGFTGCNEYAFEDAIADAIQLICFGGQVNAAAIQVASGPRAGHTLNHARDLTMEALKRLGDVASLTGTRLALKTMRPAQARHWTFLNSLHATLDLIDACGHPAVGLALEPALLLNEENPEQLLAEIMPLIASVQISDWDASDSLPDQFPQMELVEMIHESGYKGFFDLEAWSEEVWHSEYDPLLTRVRQACQSEPSHCE